MKIIDIGTSICIIVSYSKRLRRTSGTAYNMNSSFGGIIYYIVHTRVGFMKNLLTILRGGLSLSLSISFTLSLSRYAHGAFQFD